MPENKRKATLRGAISSPWLAFAAICLFLFIVLTLTAAFSGKPERLAIYLIYFGKTTSYASYLAALRIFVTVIMSPLAVMGVGMLMLYRVRTVGAKMMRIGSVVFSALCALVLATLAVYMFGTASVSLALTRSFTPALEIYAFVPLIFILFVLFLKFASKMGKLLRTFEVIVTEKRPIEISVGYVCFFSFLLAAFLFALLFTGGRVISAIATVFGSLSFLLFGVYLLVCRKNIAGLLPESEYSKPKKMYLLDYNKK
ncbi:MAG: hypothetical protein E7671_00210 [Ruminococcaceae bacterium]|nr:hypothetical protein [Oscillospiraceae bacterium]